MRPYVKMRACSQRHVDAELARARIPLHALLHMEVQGAVEGRVARYDMVTGHPMRDADNKPIYDELTSQERMKTLHHLVDKGIPTPRAVEITHNDRANEIALDALEYADTKTLEEIAGGTYASHDEEAEDTRDTESLLSLDALFTDEPGE